ncbi:hypothetical protein [Nocardioides convexus]|uniref:hypothetical protein n=1 Tax=Nocardioides convexus TaxID=2712224 RepID=UPI0024187FE8|nr:hypothetical protein [Nocardioides convexus]
MTDKYQGFVSSPIGKAPRQESGAAQPDQAWTATPPVTRWSTAPCSSAAAAA